MKNVLSQNFFEQRTVKVAEELIGKFLVRRVRGKKITSMITETEAYDGFLDKASHAHRGKTPRNKVMFTDAGHIYVYFTYGMHNMLNIITEKKEHPAAVLIRATKDVTGPGRLTKYFHITKTLNAKKLGKSSLLWIEDRGFAIPKKDIQKTPRIGINCEKEWKEKLYRFVLKTNLDKV